MLHEQNKNKINKFIEWLSLNPSSSHYLLYEEYDELLWDKKEGIPYNEERLNELEDELIKLAINF